MNSTLNTLVGLIDAMQLKDRIKEAMDGAKLTKAALARATSSTPGAVTQWLSGETKSLKAEKAALMGSATGYLSGWLVSGTGYKRMVDLPSNRPLAPVDTAQAAIKGVATLEQALEGLAIYMEGLDESDRREAMKMIASVADSPDRHAKTAAGIRGMVGAPFAQSDKKAA